MKENNNSRANYQEIRKVLALYMQAMGNNAEIFDSNFRLHEINGKTGIEQHICRHCTGGGIRLGTSCRTMHIDAMKESGRQGNFLIYQCELGLVFWVSPTYNENIYNGSLRGSGYVSGDSNESKLAEKCNGTIDSQEFVRRICELPVGDAEKIQSLAEMLLLCAEFLSGSNVNHHEMLRLSYSQMNSLITHVEELKIKCDEKSTLSCYPLDKEHRLITSLHRGDKTEAEKCLNELLATLLIHKADNFRYIQLRALELAVLFVRNGIHSNNTIIENNIRFIRQIRDSKTIEELSGTLHSIVENIAASVTWFQDIPHAAAMRKAECFIRENLTRKIRLREIAKVAGLSPPYFSTVFKEEMGENLSRYINRLRVEKASKLLLESNLTLSEIAGECCFEDQSWFTKIFKAFTGLSPGKYRTKSMTL